MAGRQLDRNWTVPQKQIDNHSDANIYLKKNMYAKSFLHGID